MRWPGSLGDQQVVLVEVLSDYGKEGTVYLAYAAEAEAAGDRSAPFVVKLGKNGRTLGRECDHLPAGLDLPHVLVPTGTTLFRDADTGDEHSAVLMAYCDQGSLRGHLEQRSLNVTGTRACELIAQAGIGLLHCANLVHRDLKPDNLLLHQGVLMVADWGMVLRAGERCEKFAGTLMYAAPEQMMADAEADQRWDVFALGCTLYELLTFVPARHLTRSMPGRERERIVREEPLQLRQIEHYVDLVLMRAVDHDPGQRSTMLMLLADLCAWDVVAARVCALERVRNEVAHELLRRTEHVGVPEELIVLPSAALVRAWGSGSGAGLRRQLNRLVVERHGLDAEEVVAAAELPPAPKARAIGASAQAPTSTLPGSRMPHPRRSDPPR